MSKRESTDTASLEAAYAEAFEKEGAVPLWRRALARPVTWIILIEVVLVLVFGILSTNNAFWSAASISNLALSSSQILLLCVAQAMLLAAGQLDLSQGAMVILSSVVAGKVMIALMPADTGNPTLSIIIGCIVAVAAGIGIGAINGFFVAKVGLNSLIATLGMLSIATGVSYVLTSGANLTGLPSELQSGFGIARIAGIPAPAVVALALVLIMGAVFHFSRFGIHTLAIGSSRRAATRSGVRASRQIIALYMLSGAAAGVAAIIDLSRFVTTDISGHTADSLAAISGAVIGGTSLTGGLISFPGAIFGSLLAVILQVGLVTLNLPPFYQTIAIGAVLIGAVTIDRLRNRNSRDPNS
ncbi:MAG: ABC transporter permease [Herbiconiux sp.]|nr:ABC transporter permease [Herbiconiux sp.]